MLLSYKSDIVNLKLLTFKYYTPYYYTNFFEKIKCLKFFRLLFASNFHTIFDEARIAQLVEQWIEDPRVTSSNLVLGTTQFN